MNPSSQDEDNDNKDNDGDDDDGGDGDHIFHIFKRSLWFGRQTADNLLSI